MGESPDHSDNRLAGDRCLLLPSILLLRCPLSLVTCKIRRGLGPLVSDLLSFRPTFGLSSETPNPDPNPDPAHANVDLIRVGSCLPSITIIRLFIKSRATLVLLRYSLHPHHVCKFGSLPRFSHSAVEIQYVSSATQLLIDCDFYTC